MAVAVMFIITAFIMYHLIKALFVITFNLTDSPGAAMVACFFAAKPLLFSLALPMTFWLVRLPGPA